MNTNPASVMVISATVVTPDPEHAGRAADLFCRAARDLLSEQIAVSVTLNISADEPEHESCP